MSEEKNNDAPKVTSKVTPMPEQPPQPFPPGMPQPERVVENIAACQRIARVGLPGSIVTVTPIVDGRTHLAFKGVFVEFIGGYAKEEAPDGKPVFGPMTDVAVMRADGSLFIASVNWIKFDIAEETS